MRLFFILLNILSLNMAAQNKGNSIERSYLNRLLLENEGSYYELVSRDYDSPNSKDKVFYYIFNNCDLIVMETKNALMLFNDEGQLYEYMSSETKNMLTGRFFGRRNIVENLETHSSSLISELFLNLDIRQEEKLRDVDLQNLNKNLKKYGYKKVIEELDLHLIAFVGAYLNEISGNCNWSFVRVRVHPFESKPNFLVNGEPENFYGAIYKFLEYSDRGFDEDGNLVDDFDIREVFKIALASRNFK